MTLYRCDSQKKMSKAWKNRYQTMNAEWMETNYEWLKGSIQRINVKNLSERMIEWMNEYSTVLTKGNPQNIILNLKETSYQQS